LEDELHLCSSLEVAPLENATVPVMPVVHHPLQPRPREEPHSKMVHRETIPLPLATQPDPHLRRRTLRNAVPREDAPAPKHLQQKPPARERISLRYQRGVQRRSDGGPPAQHRTGLLAHALEPIDLHHSLVASHPNAAPPRNIAPHPEDASRLAPIMPHAVLHGHCDANATRFAFH
tara:strand:+ start:712 stop:1239 length:528 start_codon:yes stop_codon:yes gene_type:complete